MANDVRLNAVEQAGHDIARGKPVTADVLADTSLTLDRLSRPVHMFPLRTRLRTPSLRGALVPKKYRATCLGR